MGVQKKTTMHRDGNECNGNWVNVLTIVGQ